jgi:hypothetical protein
MLVILVAGIPEVRRCNGLTWHDKRTKFHDHLEHLNNISVIITAISKGVILVLIMKGIYEVSS